MLLYGVAFSEFMKFRYMWSPGMVNQPEKRDCTIKKIYLKFENMRLKMTITVNDNVSSFNTNESQFPRALDLSYILHHFGW